MKPFLLPFLILFLMLTAACATPQRRISKHPELFNALTPQQQEAVKQGEIRIGFPPEAVRLAKGAPHRIYTRQTADATSEVWSYVRIERELHPRWLDVPTHGRHFHSLRVDIEHTREIERLRIEFHDGHVRAIETLH